MFLTAMDIQDPWQYKGKHDTYEVQTLNAQQIQK